MKQILIATAFILFVLSAHAQINAVTSNGDEVILNQDGTWKYVNDSLAQSTVKIDTNKTRFSKGPASSFLVKSNRTEFGVYLEPKKWDFAKKKSGEAAEFAFHSRDKDIYGMLISEKMEIPMESLKTAALTNAKEAAPDIKIIKEEYRHVNNSLVLFLQMNGTISGIKFTYLGYYFSSSKGTIQCITYTSTNLLDQYKKDMEDLLNGFISL